MPIVSLFYYSMSINAFDEEKEKFMPWDVLEDALPYLADD